MENKREILLGIPVAIVTLAIGIAFVAAIQMLVGLFTSSAAAQSVANAAPQKLELSCYDPNILPIWQALKQDANFQNSLDSVNGPHDCSSMLEIKRLDLNRDGRDEIFARGKETSLRLTGHVGFWAFEKRNEQYRVILSGWDVGNISDLGDIVRQSKTRGYSDILLEARTSDLKTVYTTYSFNGRDYVESRCVYEVPKENDRSEDSWELVPCKEYERRSQTSTEGAK